MDEGVGVGALIADLRTGHGLSQSRLAALLCEHAGHVTVTREEVSRWESGRRRPSAFWLLGRLNATFGGAHAAALRGDHARARELLEDGRRLHDTVGSHEQTSDYAVPHWRMSVFASLLAARLGDERAALAAQDDAAATLPESLPRFRTHLELHRGLMLARAGDGAGGLAYAQTAMDTLPPEKHSLTLRLLVAEIRGAV